MRAFAPRARGLTLFEVLFAFTLALIFVGAIVDRILADARVQAFVFEERRANEALKDAYERLRAGIISPPYATKQGNVSITVVRDSRKDARLANAGLVPVVLRASWTSSDGKLRSRELAATMRGAP